MGKTGCPTSKRGNNQNYKLNQLTFNHIELIELQLAKTPNAYNLHVELIDTLKKLGDFDQLRYARQTMQKMYPLSDGSELKTLPMSLSYCWLLIIYLSLQNYGWSGSEMK